MRDDDDDGARRHGRGAPRRAVMQATLAGLGGIATAQLLPLVAGGGAALAAPASSGAGPKVTPDPLKTSIQKSGVTVELVDFSAPPRTKSTPPYAMLNFLYHAGDGSGRLFACDSRGKIWRIDRGTGAAALLLDVRAARGGALIFNNRHMGLRSFAFHPDAARPGRPGHRKLYTASVETVASAPAGVRVFAGPFSAIAHNVVAEWSVDAADPSRVDPRSRRELFRVAVYDTEHCADQLMFDPNAGPGSAAYGKMYVGVGDGGNVVEHPDPYDQAQAPGRALGKILRIDPLRRADGKPYGVPADNPFVGRSGYLPEIWALGLRHPEKFSFDRGGSGAMLIADIGQNNIEEVNLGRAGANYGWPLREGRFVTDRANGRILYGLGTADTGKSFTYPVAVYDHSDGTAVTGGYVYRGTAVPALRGHYVFGDIVNGRVFHVPVAELRQGSQATIKELTLRRGGREVTLLGLVGAANNRVDLRLGQEESGEVYVMTKQDGRIRRLRTG